MNILVINMGIPGSGKTTMSNYIKNKLNDLNIPCKICSADNYQMVDGEYQWNINKVGYAHQMAIEDCYKAMNSNEVAIYDNTNTKKSDFSKLLKIVKENYDIYIIGIVFIPSSIENHYTRQIHSVPIETILKMYDNLNNLEPDQFDKLYKIYCDNTIEDNKLVYDKIIDKINKEYFT